MSKPKTWVMAVRAPFFTASIVPVLLGTSIAYYQNVSINWLYFLLTLIAGVFLHAGANVINDYFDHVTQNDEINTEFVRPFTGGSRMIQNGLMTPKEVLAEGLICLFIGSAIGFYLVYQFGWVILALGVFGVFSSVFYVEPRVNLVSRGIGELLIGLNFGVLMTFGAFYVQTQSFSWLPIIASLPVALLIAAVLYINEFPDAKADYAVGKLHLVVRLGKEKAVKGFVLMIMLTYLVVIVGVAVDFLPPMALISLLTLPLALKAIKVAQANYDDSLKLVPANASTIMNHLFTGLLLTIAFFIDRLI
ncbi:MAG: 1,4-dihydroxy-2-naphthoate octaprenyltransferase [Calditrichaeota bacterium]|nr:1,4-dihydroxy-2-naphthoate octaprenyltransferase [Calditrichota bacterium]